MAAARSGGSGGTAHKLTAAQREMLRGLILAERLGNSEILARIEGLGVSVTHQTISYYRRQYLPELQASDLEAIQAGATTFVARASALSTAAGALLEAAVDPTTGKLKKTKGAAFNLQVLAQVLDQMQRLAQGAEDRVWKREKIETEREKVAIERGRLELERRRLAMEEERHALDMMIARREALLLEQEDAAAAVSDEAVVSEPEVVG